jgi:hypothetical protein
LRVCSCGSLSLTWGRVCSFTIAAGRRQRSHSRVRVLLDSWPYVYFTVSDSRLAFSPPSTTRRVMVEVFDPASVFESYVTTDGQSASLSWNKAPIWGLRPDFITVRQLRVGWYGAFSLTRGLVCRLQLLLAFARAGILGSEFRGTREHILLSQIRDFPFCRLLRLSGEYSSCFSIFGRPCTEHLIQRLFLVFVVTVCLCTQCLGNVHEPLPSKISCSLSGSTTPAFRLCLPSRCLAVDVWLRLHYCGFRSHITVLSIKYL